MSNGSESDNRILALLSQEFVETARDQLEEIEETLEALQAGNVNAEDCLLSIQRHVHNIKGQGATFGFPNTGRVAHFLEDYLKNISGFKKEHIPDVQAYLDMMTDLIASNESIALDDPQALFKSLPSGLPTRFSSQKDHTVTVMLAMPPGLQRKLVAKELLSCGFRVMRAYDSMEALSVAASMQPQVVFIDMDITPFNGLELCRMFAASERLRDLYIVLLSDRKEGKGLREDMPDNVSIVLKTENFTEGIGESLIEWGVFETP